MAGGITLHEYAKGVDELGDRIGAAAMKGVRSAARRLHAMIIEELHKPGAFGQNAPHDTGELQRSIKTVRIGAKSLTIDDIVLTWQEEEGYEVFLDAPHAAFIEYGTRPHHPPLEPLAEWAYRKGIADTEEEALEVASAIAWKIAKYGTLPYHFFERALHRFKSEDVLKREVEHEISRVTGRG